LRVQENQPVMDLVEIDAASNTQVEKIRDHIIDKVNMAPAQGRYRVYIIDEVHMLSTSSFNALLKTLEEPPAHAIFILATTDAHKIPVTVTSRCQRYDFRRIGINDIEERLRYVAEKEEIELDADAASLIARSADGALRDALSLLEQVAAYSPRSINENDVRMVLGTVSRELLASLVEAVAQGDGHAVLEQLDNAVAEGASFSQLAKDLTNYCRDLMLLTVGYATESTFSEADKAQRQEQAKSLGRDRLLGMVDALRTAEKDMRQSTDHRLLLELTLVRASANLLEAPKAIAPRQVTPQPQIPAKAPTPVPRPITEQTAPVKQPVATDKIDPSGWAGSPSQPPGALGESALPVRDNVSEEKPVTPIETPPSAAPKKPSNSKGPGKGRRISDLEEFIELWPYVLLRIRKKISIPAVAYLHDAMPVELNETVAVLEFQKQFHYEKAC
jgi:DNA polymerase-3 subunit gamma/tau